MIVLVSLARIASSISNDPNSTRAVDRRDLLVVGTRVYEDGLIGLILRERGKSCSDVRVRSVITTIFRDDHSTQWWQGTAVRMSIDGGSSCWPGYGTISRG